MKVDKKKEEKIKYQELVRVFKRAEKEARQFIRKNEKAERELQFFSNPT